MSRWRWLILAVAATALGGCAQPGTQAPKPQAKLLNDAAASISFACGSAEELTAFGGSGAVGLAPLEQTATGGVHKLVTVWKQNRTWIYQGESINGVVADSFALLGSCGLRQAQHALGDAVHP
jgi:hypothetical protein